MLMRLCGLAHRFLIKCSLSSRTALVAGEFAQLQPWEGTPEDCSISIA